VTVVRGGQVLLGRHQDSPYAELFAGYLEVGRRHATVGYDQRGPWIRDEYSVNQTLINGESIRADVRVPLKAGDRIVLGTDKVWTRVFLRASPPGGDRGHD
jgi:pSer/pThr/pTyr-binding forkhead associated (FHA) protein